MQLDTSTDVGLDAARWLTRDLPRDQALGLRLMAMARAAAGVHMGAAALGGVGAGDESRAQERAGMPQLLRSQAKGLVGQVEGEIP